MKGPRRIAKYFKPMNAKRFHNIFDLENCNDNISNRKKVKEFIERITEAMEMKILKGPVIVKGVKENPGLSAFAIIDLSHISIHTFTESQRALIDVFSCKEYNRNHALQICKEFFVGPETKISQKEVWWG